MKTVLFVTWDGGGNVPPIVLMAREVVRRGDSARVIGHPAQRAAIEEAGLDFEEYRQAKRWSVLAPKAGLRADLEYAAVFSDRGMGRDVIDSLRRRPADRVVVDGLLIGVLGSLDRADIPYTILIHTLRSVMFGALVSGPLGMIMRLRGFRPRELYAAAEAEVVATEASLDPGSGRLPSSIRYTGPILPPIVAAAHASTPPTVLVSLSTTFVAGQVDLLQRVIDTLAPLDVQAVVTTGPAIDTLALRASENTLVHAFLPHADVMSRASLVVGHGGHATTMLALAHGIPLLIIPTNPSFDQPAVARMITSHGLGLNLPKRASAAQIHAAIIELLSNPAYSAAAAQLGAQMRSRSSVHDAVDILTSSPGAEHVLP
ncbi:glycosyltransferase [uncultured Microbacterium sp.]|uniref:glycosyltransferase n=1 Tax=uncultured Microbacterium sp. TaxID=191216 RepID=UPI0035C967AE